MKLSRLCYLLLLPGLFLSPESLGSDWTYYGSDAHSSKYAPLDQISKRNVSELEVAWRWASPDNDAVAAGSPVPFTFKSTPIQIGETLYTSTSLGYVVALNAATGRSKWVFSTEAFKGVRPPNFGYNHRGVAYWRSGDQERILMPANDARLWSIDAKTGQPDAGFGTEGVVDLTLGLGRDVDRRHYGVVSAPIVVNDVVIVGSVVSDGALSKEMPPGHVRGYDIRTGKMLWIFRTIPQKGEYGVDTWEDDSWEYSGNTNVWTLMSADSELGYVYLPTGTPTNDWYGGHRHGDNLFAESLVCLDAKTGERVWHYQAVHHGMWDYDLPAAPNLIDIVVDGKEIKAVAQISKQGFIYVLDRQTGKPVWPIEERSVPQSKVPGEQSSPTQPFPTWPLPYEHQGISDATLINFSPELKAKAWEIVKEYEYGPLYTPPSIKGTINLPGWGGGANWTGAAVDPESGRIYIPSSTGPIVVKLAKANFLKSDMDYLRSRSVNAISGPEGLPLTKPPYARITAIDLNTGEHIWMVPHGEGIRQQIIDKGFADPGPVGSRGSTGPLLTKSLLFLGQGGRRHAKFRAFDKDSGAVVHEMDLPQAPTGTPMTYMSRGRQYIVMATGGMNDAGLVALPLPLPAPEAP